MQRNRSYKQNKVYYEGQGGRKVIFSQSDVLAVIIEPNDFTIVLTGGYELPSAKDEDERNKLKKIFDETPHLGDSR